MNAEIILLIEYCENFLSFGDESYTEKFQRLKS